MIRITIASKGPQNRYGRKSDPKRKRSTSLEAKLTSWPDDVDSEPPIELSLSDLEYIAATVAILNCIL
jgi:hypothetical protein